MSTDTHVQNTVHVHAEALGELGLLTLKLWCARIVSPLKKLGHNLY